MKVLFHIDESPKWSLVLANAKNFIDYQLSQDKTAKVQILANSLAVADLDMSNEANAKILERMKELADSKVKIYACKNALKGQNIAEENLPDFVSIVPAGVVFIAEQQLKGVPYIKP